MKSTVIGLIILLLTAVTVFVSPAIIRTRLESIEECVSATQDEDGAIEVMERIEDSRLLLSLFLPDRVLSELRGYATDLYSAVKSGAATEVGIAKSRLVEAIDQQKRLVGFDLEAII